MIDEVKARIGYVDPPAELVPAKSIYTDGPAWDRLLAWFEEHTSNKFDALLVILAERRGWTIPQAYMYTDNWVKVRTQVDDEGNYCSYN